MCNEAKLCNCLIISLLTMILSIKERIFLVGYNFREDNTYNDLVQQPDLTTPDLYLWEAVKLAVKRDRPRMLNELKTSISAYIRKSSQPICRKCLRIKLNGFSPVSTLVDIQHQL
jgi:hypothetical protein